MEQDSAKFVEFPRPELIGEYFVDRVIACGVSRQVFRCFDQATNQCVAVSVLRSDASEQNVHRFHREMSIWAKFTHPNVAALVDSGTFRNQPFFVVECFDQGTLGEFIHDAGLPLGYVAKVFVDVMAAIKHIHQREIVHHGIAPDSLYVRDNGTVALTGFALATDDGLAANDIRSLGNLIQQLVVGTKAFETCRPTVLPASTPESMQSLVRDCLEFEGTDTLSFLNRCERELTRSIENDEFGSCGYELLLEHSQPLLDEEIRETLDSNTAASKRDDDIKIEPGIIVHDYQLQERLGFGGMGTVWKATSTNGPETVAIKFLRNQFRDCHVTKDVLLAAYRKQDQLSHQNICKTRKLVSDTPLGADHCFGLHRGS